MTKEQYEKDMSKIFNKINRQITEYQIETERKQNNDEVTESDVDQFVNDCREPSDARRGRVQ